LYMATIYVYVYVCMNIYAKLYLHMQNAVCRKLALGKLNMRGLVHSDRACICICICICMYACNVIYDASLF
jgi:hypothetical protein